MTDKKVIRAQLEDALRDVLRDYHGHLSTTEILSAVGNVCEALDAVPEPTEAEAPPELERSGAAAGPAVAAVPTPEEPAFAGAVSVEGEAGGMLFEITRGDDRRVELAVRISSPEVLERELANLIDVQALCLRLPESLDVMTELDICLHIGTLDSLGFEGRVVHVSPEGTAVQLFGAGPAIEARLVALLDELYSARYGTPALDEDSLPERSSLAQDSDPRSGVAPEVWNVNPRDVFQRIVTLCDSAESGTIALESEDGESIEITLFEGLMIDVQRVPSRPKDEIGYLLLAAGKLDADALGVAERHARLHGIAVSDALLAQGAIEAAALRLALKTRLIYMARHLDSCDWTRISLWRHERPHALRNTPPISLVGQLFQVLFKGYKSVAVGDLDRLQRRFERQRVQVELDGDRLDPLGLDERQRRYVEVGLSEARHFHEAVKVSPLTASDTIFLIATLDDLGLLTKDAVNEWTRQLTRQREQIGLIHAQLARESYFDMLGLHWSAYTEEVEHAYEGLLEQYDDSNFPDPEQHAELAEIRAKITRAYEILEHPRKRMKHRESIVSDFKLRTAVDMFRQQAEGAQTRRDIDVAIDFHRRVLELEPADSATRRLLSKLVDYRERGAPPASS